MWLGNSYTYVNDVPKTVQNLRIANGQPNEIQYDEHLEGGWTWEMHANSEVSKTVIDKLSLISDSKIPHSSIPGFISISVSPITITHSYTILLIQDNHQQNQK